MKNLFFNSVILNQSSRAEVDCALCHHFRGQNRGCSRMIVDEIDLFTDPIQLRMSPVEDINV